MPITNQLRKAADRLATAGLQTPRTDAELLAAFILGVPRNHLILVDHLSREQEDQLSELIEERARRVPLQHLTGTAPFLGLELQVGPGVFIPRPETELLARWGIEMLAGQDSPVVVDLCSGSGTLALAVAHEYPKGHVYAVERSPAALEWLRRNVSGSSVEVIEGDIREVELPTDVDLVLSNPPYVPSGVEVPEEVLADPHEAVFAGGDGLELIPAVIARAAQMLRAGGRLGFEHDDSHLDLFRPDQSGLLQSDFDEVTTHPDLAGRPRFTTATKRT